MTSFLPQYQNQGQAIVLGWNHVSTLKNWTAYIAGDGNRFLPPFDRDGYTDGVERRLPTGRVLMAGLPIARQKFPWVSDGQIDYLYDTFNGQNVTVSIHKPTSTTKYDVVNYNAVANVLLNQAATLTRKRNGYEGFELELVLVEPL